MPAVQYPIWEPDFANIRHDGTLYVDKSELIYSLAKRGRYYFLSRPLRHHATGT